MHCLYDSLPCPFLTHLVDQTGSSSGPATQNVLCIDDKVCVVQMKFENGVTIQILVTSYFQIMESAISWPKLVKLGPLCDLLKAGLRRKSKLTSTMMFLPTCE